MAEILGIASGVAGLISLAMEITRLSYGYISDIRSAHSTQKEYLREMSALTEVLLRIEEAIEGLEDQAVAMTPSTNLSKGAIRDCTKELDSLRSELEKPSPSIFWPLKELALKKTIQSLHQYRSIFSSFLAAQTLVTVSATHREVNRLGYHQDQTELLAWIGNPKDTSGPVLSPFPGTGEWFVESDTYRNWVVGNGSSLLWCHGPPGVGKSILASVALQHLSESLDGASVCLLHYFCEFSNRKEQKKEAIWKSLLRQVITQGRIQAIATLKSRLGSSRPASSKDLSDALDTICSSEKVIIILDGPDELENVKDMKAILNPFMKHHCKILVTSRDLPEIRSILTMASILEVQADRNDLRSYVASQFEENDLEDLLEKYPELEMEIIDKSNGIFLLGKILVNHLLELTTAKEMRKALQFYPAHLDQAFESSLERINSQSKSHSALAHRVIGWIVSAEKKLLMSELIHGLGIEEGIDIIEAENLLAPKTILKVCGGLVNANLQDGTVNMVHTTVYTWFRNRDTVHFHEDLARSCLRYLTIRPLSAGPAETAEEMDERMGNLPFLSYAAQHWRKHILDDTMERNLGDIINILLDNANFRSAAFQASNYQNRLKDLAIRSASFEAIPTHHSILHVAAYWNLPNKISEVLTDGGDLNTVDSQDWTPLHWACFGRSQKAIPVLVAHGAEIDAKDSVGWTPLFWAALNGDTATVQLLLTKNANHLERDMHSWTALRWAAARQQTDVIRILLNHHTKNLSRFQESRKTSLKQLSVQEALRYSTKKDVHSDLLDELQDQKITASLENYDSDDLYSILHDESFDVSQLWNSGHFDPPVGNVWRTMNKAERINGIEYYIEKKSIGSESPRAWRSNLLYAAIKDDRLLAVKLLIELGADVNDKKTRTPLHAAAFRKDPSMAEVLLDHGANIEAIDYQGLTPLQQAVLNGFEKTVKLLLSRGANVNFMCLDTEKEGTKVHSYKIHFRSETASSKTPLMLACGLSVPSEDPALPNRIVQLLLENGADVNMREIGPEGMTAIHYAARSRNPQILQLVIDAGANCTALDNLSRTSIHHLVLGIKETRMASPLLDSDGNCLPGMATSCLTILSQICGTEYLSQTAEWMEHYKVSRSCWEFMMSIHSPMSLAILLGDWEVFQGLRRFKARFETNVPLDTMLDEPFLALQPDAVDLLSENGANIPSKGAPWIGQIYALSSSHDITKKEVERLTAILIKLVSRGLDINTKGWNEQTLLHKTVFRLELCELTKSLLKLGSDPCQKDGDGLDSFILAGLSHNFDTLRDLLEHTKKHPIENHWTQYLDYSKTTQDSEIITAICSAIKIKGLIDSACKSGTLLCQAVRSGNEDFVRALVKYDADTNLGDDQGQRPLHFGAANGHTSIVETLVSSGAALEVCDKTERTPLHLSALNGHVEVIKLLLSNGASPITADSRGWQPLHFAVWGNNTEAVHCLIKAGVSLHATTSHYSSQGQRGKPSRLSYNNKWTGTPLHLAAMVGNVAIVKLLLMQRGGVNVNARTDNFELIDNYDSAPPVPTGGPTALHITLDNTKRFHELDRSFLEIAALLVENGASVEGVADHLNFEDIQKFQEFPQLWDALRVGISAED
ncbi:hypothetical protein BP5796_13011 [Coleophoma crateriformis]|uniref:Nephrocystin 3-like N-terminal domain-containing protein n=1 Tax=Coleophoma crateriformis TaxID=565419 RepID=A0A3D8Q6B0_9HELO|nr:hypothetical protein BP5796_13011 [Coleophoma crateriformis]